MTLVSTSVVDAVNTLTTRWCAVAGEDDFAVSGAGVWPLLALLTSAADEFAQRDLVAALGIPACDAQRAALDLIELLDSAQSASAALGLWVRKNLPLQQEWTSALPDGVVAELTDQATLDHWAADHTGGLISEFPLTITTQMVLVLASALLARTEWVDPFSEHDGQLSRTTRGTGGVAILERDITRVIVTGHGDLDVHLVIGDGTAAHVLAVGIGELTGRATVDSLDTFSAATRSPGLTVKYINSPHPSDVVSLSLPAFDIRCSHDLLDQIELFGLRGIAEPDRGHLPGLSVVPLYVSDGAQEIVATFSATGFEAAAVSAFGLRMGSALPRDSHLVKLVQVDVDRPFGFIAVHRPHRLAIAAGWVRTPFR